MTQTAPRSRFRTLAAALFFAACGVAGSFAGRFYGNAFDGQQAWIGPAILIGSLACFVAGILLLPAAIGGVRAGRAAANRGQTP
jgi:hypothetical protein